MIRRNFRIKGGNHTFRPEIQGERGSKKCQDKNNFSKTIHNKEISGDTATF